MQLTTLVVTSLAAGSASAFHWGTSAPPAGFGAAAAATDAVAPAPAGFSSPPSGPPSPGAPGARRPVQADMEEEDAAFTATAEYEPDCEEDEESVGEGEDNDAVVASSTTIFCPTPTSFIWNGAPVAVTAPTVLTLPCTTDAAGATVSFFLSLFFSLFPIVFISTVDIHTTAKVD